jgi:glutaryl-CoA dehydrogenase
MPFHGVDYFQVADLLTDEEKLISATFRRFVDDEIMPGIGRHFRNGTFDQTWPRRLGTLGALGANLVGYGCAGLARRLRTDHAGAGARRLRRAQLRVGARRAGACTPSTPFGSEEQKQRYLPEAWRQRRS